MTPNEEARLVLLAAVALLRDGEVDNYSVARLEAQGYTRRQVEDTARMMADQVLAGAKLRRVLFAEVASAGSRPATR